MNRRNFVAAIVALPCFGWLSRDRKTHVPQTLESFLNDLLRLHREDGMGKIALQMHRGKGDDGWHIEILASRSATGPCEKSVSGFIFDDLRIQPAANERDLAGRVGYLPECMREALRMRIV
jgi:hypothetical protein